MPGVLKVKAGGVWVPVGGAAEVAVQATEPAGTPDGHLWWDTDEPVSADLPTAGQGVSLGHTTAQSIPHNTATAVVFDTEYFDSAGFHGTGSRITIPAGLGGRYLVNYYVAFYAVAGGNSRQGWVRRNGSASDRIAASLGFGSASYVGQLGGTAILDLVAGDYIEAVAFHDQGAAQSLQGNDAAAHIIEFSAVCLRPA